MLVSKGNEKRCALDVHTRNIARNKISKGLTMDCVVNKRLKIQRTLELLLALLRKRKTNLAEIIQEEKNLGWVFQVHKQLVHFHVLIQELKIHERQYSFRLVKSGQCSRE